MSTGRLHVLAAALTAERKELEVSSDECRKKEREFFIPWKFARLYGEKELLS